MNKRILLTGSILGIVAGIFCWWSAIFFLKAPFTTANLIFLILNRLGLGLAVALGTLALPQVHWYLRGPAIAFIIGLVVTYFDFMMGYGWVLTMVVNLMSLSYGLVIDGLLTYFDRKHDKMRL